MTSTPLLLTGLFVLIGCNQLNTVENEDQGRSLEKVAADCRASINDAEPRISTIMEAQKRQDALAALNSAKKYLASKDEVGCLHQIELIRLDLGQDVNIRPKH